MLELKRRVYELTIVLEVTLDLDLDLDVRLCYCKEGNNLFTEKY
jgi:hypothetical protein